MGRKKRELEPGVEPKPKETKLEILTRLAGARVPKAVKMIRRIGNLSAYGPTHEQSGKIVAKLQTAVNEVEALLMLHQRAPVENFEL